MPTIHLMTWNINERELSQTMVLRHVDSMRKKGRDYIIAIQEGIDDYNTMFSRTGSSGAGNGNLVLLCSFAVVRTENHYRFVMCELSVHGRTVVVFNYHGQSNINHSSLEVRGGLASEYRWLFGELSRGHEFLVMGDFNAEPGATEINDPACLCFGPQSPASLKSHNRARQGVQIKAPQDGTYTHRYFHNGMFHDKVYDYFAATPSLASQLVDVKKCRRVGNKVITTESNGQPTASDHFPVEATWVI